MVVRWSHDLVTWWSHAGEDWIKMPGVNPTFWLNYIFFTNPYHWNGTVREPHHTLYCDYLSIKLNAIVGS